MLQLKRESNYHECKLETFAIYPGSLSSFFYALCNTVNIPPQLEPALIRKSVSYSKLARYVREHITNDFDKWRRENSEESTTFLNAVASLINEEEGRTEMYYQQMSPKEIQQWVSDPFYSHVYGINMVLVQL
jgi:hypothetical protein